MKIKITLLGLFFANSTIDPIYADQYGPQLKADEDLIPMVEQGSLKAEEATQNKDNQAKSKDLIKLGTTLTMSPTIVFQDQKVLPKNSFGTQLTFNVDVPKAWCNKDATAKIATNWDGKTLTIKNAAVAIGKMVTIGYTSSIFGYEKGDPALLISAAATVLQIKYGYTFDWFRIGYAIERPIALQVGLFDKNHSEEKGDKKENDRTNKFDKSDDKNRPFKIKNSIPAVGLNLGVITDQFNISLSGLGRYTDYTHGINTDEKDVKYYFTGGGNLGIQYQVIPKKFTVTGQGAYVYGLGDYLSGLAAIRDDNERQEICAAYYVDKERDELFSIIAWGLGTTLEYCATPKWTFSIRGSYLTTAKDSKKPSKAFRAQWNIIPKVAYALNEYFKLSGSYSMVKELKIDKKENKPIEYKLSGGISFSL